MRLREYKFFVNEYDSVMDLPEEDRALVLEAREAANSAYAPYSRYRVGAALRLANGKLIKGNNQENADFTDGLCAERVALFYANANFPEEKVFSLAVTSFNSAGLTEGPAQPCGSCRQVLVETEARYNHPIRLILDGSKRVLVVEGAGKLLPFAFKPDSLD